MFGLLIKYKINFETNFNEINEISLIINKYKNKILKNINIEKNLINRVSLQKKFSLQVKDFDRNKKFDHRLYIGNGKNFDVLIEFDQGSVFDKHKMYLKN